MGHTLSYCAEGCDSLFKIWHQSGRHMLIYFYSDGGSVVCSENIYPIRRGGLCFVGAGKYHYTMPDHPETYKRSKLFFSRDYFRQLLPFLPEGFHPDASFIYAQLPPEKIPEAEALFTEIHREETARYHDMLFASCCIRLFYLLNCHAVEQVSNPLGYIGQTLDFINNHIYEEFSLDDICRELHVSKSYLCRLFKERMQTTVMDYILKTRIILAENLLIEQNCSVSEISSRCGFSEVSSFSRAFKRETGKTPLSYRKGHRKF